MADRVRIEIGFDGGQIMGARRRRRRPSTGSSRRSPRARTGRSALDVEDGRYTVALRRIVYVKRFSREGRVGFGA